MHWHISQPQQPGICPAGRGKNGEWGWEPPSGTRSWGTASAGTSETSVTTQNLSKTLKQNALVSSAQVSERWRGKPVKTWQEGWLMYNPGDSNYRSKGKGRTCRATSRERPSQGHRDTTVCPQHNFLFAAFCFFVSNTRVPPESPPGEVWPYRVTSPLHGEQPQPEQPPGPPTTGKTLRSGTGTAGVPQLCKLQNTEILRRAAAFT